MSSPAKKEFESKLLSLMQEVYSIFEGTTKDIYKKKDKNMHSTTGSHIPNDWLHPVNHEEAKYIQQQLAERLILYDDFTSPQHIAGMDVSNNLYDPQSMIYAATVVLNPHTWQIEEQASTAQFQSFPYIPGFLGFREAPALVETFKQLTKRPDIILVDGHGISHPRQLGIASHIGVLLDIPTIGVAKSILVGQPADSLGDMKGDQTPLLWKGKQIAIVLKSKMRCKPLIISAGHRISLESALEIVLQCITRYRLPEPTRQAHLAANHCRKQYLKIPEQDLLQKTFDFPQ